MNSLLKENKQISQSKKNTCTDIDSEWANFISSKYDEKYSESESDSDENEDYNINNCKQKNANINNSDNDNHNDNDNDNVSQIISANLSLDLNQETPKCSDIYISTKTKIAYLSTPIKLKEIFWEIPIIPYSKPCNGVIKKQIKFNSFTVEELNEIKERLKDVNYYDEHIITSINNPNGRTKFKDIRKISVGISKKDLMSYRSKKKSAFYNCFVLILRLKVENTNNNINIGNNVSSNNVSGNSESNYIFKEYHVKVFNTGKLEIPGIQNEKIFNIILQQVIDILQPYFEEKITYKDNSTETVLINSNFNCGFFINREILYEILRNKYNIQAIYDPCSYPGIQCKFYYNPDIGVQTGIQISEDNKELYKNIKEVSFMIFRTGSVLIVGKCDENVLIIIYEFLKIILNNEYKQICQKNKVSLIIEDDDCSVKEKDKTKNKKIRRKIITIDK